MFRNSSLSSLAKLACILATVASPKALLAGSFTQINLVSDESGLAAVTDANLKNPWGVAFTATSPFWVSDQKTGVSSLYTGTPVTQGLVVTIPGGGGPPSGPTGVVNNGGSGFIVGGSPSLFIFDTLNGTVAGWNNSLGTTAMTMATTAGAVFTGLAIGNNASGDFLYAANSLGGINVFDSSFAPASLSSNFTDPNGIAGFDPFNIQELNGDLYVTYAHLTATGGALPGGYVDEYDNNGVFLKRVATGGALFAPWGIVFAPAGFGNLGGDLLVGNFGNGEILEYDTSGNFLGTLDDPNGSPIVNQNLWALEFRTGGTGVNTNALYFTAGINGEQDGLFGEIVPTAEPSTLIMIGSALLFGGLFLRRRTCR